MTKHCLIIIDMQNDYLARWKRQDLAKLVNHTNELIDAYRKANHLVIWVRQAFKADLSDAFMEMRNQQISITIENTFGSKIHGDLKRLPSDLVITKKRYSAFFQTELGGILTKNNIDQLTLAGVNTHACIRMTAIDAYQRDLAVCLAADCISSLDTEHARISLKYMNGKIAALKNNPAIIKSLQL